MIVALAGRRVDAPDAKTPRFPTAEVDRVEAAIRHELGVHDTRALVCAAACGADLLALSAAADRDVRFRIVLPFSVSNFRTTSVVDRPSTYPWGSLYDRFVVEAQARGDLVLLDLDPQDPQAYEKTNLAILDEALALALRQSDESEAIVVWDPRNRTEHDLTEHFAREARARNMPVKTINILERS
jgi:hypothetical protein